MSAEVARHRLWITVAVMSATVMQVLDTTIVNVALPQMQGQLGATPDQISWVLTSYMVASGVFMPLTGYFSDRLGQKRYLLLSIAGFTLSSVLCGLAANLVTLVLLRLLQGVFGAALVPLSQSIMVRTYPPAERGRAMAIWGVGVMVGPILGPTLGGYLTEVLNWRWTFFINLPVGLLSLLLAWRVVPDSERRERGMDWFGLTLLALAIGGLQWVLDRGSQEDWFSSPQIQLAALVSLIGFAGFALHSRSGSQHVLFHADVFRDRNFVTASLLLAIFGLGLFGNMMLQPLMLEHLLGYPTITTGLTLAPRGVASMLSMMLVGRLIGRVDPRALIVTGILICIFGSWFATRYTMSINVPWVVWPPVIQGFGLGMVFVPLSTLAFSTLAPAYAAEAAGLFSLLRTIGSSIGISIVATTLTRQGQVLWNQLSGHISIFNPAVHTYLGAVGMSVDSPQAALLLGRELARQTTMTAFVDAYMLVMWSFVAMLPLVFVMKYQRGQAPAAATGVAAD